MHSTCESCIAQMHSPHMVHCQNARDLSLHSFCLLHPLSKRCASEATRAISAVHLLSIAGCIRRELSCPCRNVGRWVQFGHSQCHVLCLSSAYCECKVLTCSDDRSGVQSCHAQQRHLCVWRYGQHQTGAQSALEMGSREG